MTTGEAHKSCIQQYDLNNPLNMSAQLMLSSKVAPKAQRITMGRSESERSHYLTATMNPNEAYQQQKYKLVGNQSRNAASWLGGPKHEIREQRIPGYSGFLPGINSENLFGKSFTKCSAMSINNKIEKGFDMSIDKRYQSQNNKSFNPRNFRRMVENPQLTNKKDYHEYTMNLNLSALSMRGKDFESTLTGSRIAGGSGSNSFKSPRSNSVMYYDPRESSLSPPKSLRPSGNHYGFQNEVQIKPVLLEKKLLERDQFHQLSEGFKKLFVEDDGIDQTDIVIPISGYCGHRKGSKAENMFGKCYRNITIQSKRIEREASLNKSSYVKN